MTKRDEAMQMLDHGDLIDRDALKNTIMESLKEHTEGRDLKTILQMGALCGFACECTDAAPTVIEADRREE